MLIVASSIVFAVPQQSDDPAKVDGKYNRSPDDIIIPGTGKIVKKADLQKNIVIKTGKFKQLEGKNKSSFGSDMAEVIKNNKLIDENQHDTALSVTCENGECTYQLIKLGEIPTTTVHVETVNYAVEQAYAWIPDPTNKPNWNFGTFMKVPREPPNKGSQFSAYFGSLIGATTILQPVIEWGQVGYKYWVMNPVFVWTDRSIYVNGTRIRVPVGNWIQGGVFTYSPHWWMLWTADRGPSGTASPALASSGIYIYDGEAIGITSSQLEVYDLNYCNQYPGSATILTGFSDGFQP